MRWHTRPVSWKKTWHRWFAWHPVYLLDGLWVWLEPVMRRAQMHRDSVYDYEYRELGDFP